MNFKSPFPPVTVQFTPDGMLLVGIVKGQMYHRVLSWKDLYKLAKQGKKSKPEGFLKKATDKMVEMTDAIARSAAASAASAAASEKLRATLRATKTLPPVMPVPPFTPTPMRTVPMAPPGAQGAQAAPPIIPPPSASEM